MVLRIDEAIARCKANGVKIFKRELAAKIYPEANKQAQQVNMTKLAKGMKYVKPEWIITICKECNCSADYLLGIKDGEEWNE